jgi:hypothetical protein
MILLIAIASKFIKENISISHGALFAHQQYTTNASGTAEQTGAVGYGIFYYPNGTNYPHLEVLENFNPNLSIDPFRWIPKGLFYDLFSFSATSHAVDVACSI